MMPNNPKIRSLVLSVFIGITLIACDSRKDPRRIGSVTVGNPAAQSNWDSKLGLSLSYSSNLTLKEDLGARRLRVDNSEVIARSSLKEARISSLEIEAIQAPRDLRITIGSAAELEHKAKQLFPEASIGNLETLAAGALSVEATYEPSDNSEWRRDRLVLLQDNTVLKVSAAAYPEADGQALIGSAYLGIRTKAGSDGLTGRHVEYVAEHVNAPRSMSGLQINWPQEISKPAGSYRVRLWSSQKSEKKEIREGFEIHQIGDDPKVGLKEIPFPNNPIDLMRPGRGIFLEMPETFKQSISSVHTVELRDPHSDQIQFTLRRRSDDSSQFEVQDSQGTSEDSSAWHPIGIEWKNEENTP